MLRDPAFVAGDFDTSFVETGARGGRAAARDRRIEVAVAAAAIRAFEARRAVARSAPETGGASGVARRRAPRGPRAAGWGAEG